jgi:hypothetical protein
MICVVFLLTGLVAWFGARAEWKAAERELRRAGEKYLEADILWTRAIEIKIKANRELNQWKVARMMPPPEVKP